MAESVGGMCGVASSRTCSLLLARRSCSGKYHMALQPAACRQPSPCQQPPHLRADGCQVEEGAVTVRKRRLLLVQGYERLPQRTALCREASGCDQPACNYSL